MQPWITLNTVHFTPSGNVTTVIAVEKTTPPPAALTFDLLTKMIYAINVFAQTGANNVLAEEIVGLHTGYYGGAHDHDALIYQNFLKGAFEFVSRFLTAPYRLGLKVMIRRRRILVSNGKTT